MISVEPEGLELDIFKYLSTGNDIVSDYSTLLERVSHYLNGGKVSRDLIDKREKFINNYLYSADGRSEIGRACVGKECRSRWSPYH